MINPELIHATLEAIRYSRRTVRGICTMRIPEEEKKVQKDRGRERERGGRAKNALLVNSVASHAYTLVHMQRPKIVISWDITRRPTPSHRTCFIPGAAINHAMFNKLQRVGSRNNTHIRREFTRAHRARMLRAPRRYLRFFSLCIRRFIFFFFRF